MVSKESQPDRVAYDSGNRWRGFAMKTSQFQRIRRGDGTDFDWDKFVEFMTPQIYSIGRRSIPDEATLRDLVQTVVVQVWEKIEDFNSRKGGFATWLAQITSSKIIDFWRK